MNIHLNKFGGVKKKTIKIFKSRSLSDNNGNIYLDSSTHTQRGRVWFFLGNHESSELSKKKKQKQKQKNKKKITRSEV